MVKDDESNSQDERNEETLRSFFSNGVENLKTFKFENADHIDNRI